MLGPCSAILLLGLTASLALYHRYRRTASADGSVSHGFIVTNSVFHRRFLPTKSQHEFLYTTQSLLLSLRHLEDGRLDLCAGRLFGYGASRLRCTAISRKNFLSEPPCVAEVTTIASSLQEVLRANLGNVADRLNDVWMLAMPTYLGVGMNPLTVYFCYDDAGTCFSVVLEVHSTFSERHVYVLQLGTESAERGRIAGFDHLWTFPKQFHVSPFCERAGFYECSIVVPSAAPKFMKSGISLRLPHVRLNLLTPEDLPRLRMTTRQRAVSMIPLTTRNMLQTVASTPFAWLLTFSRILYQAYILHYVKGLDVYQRPEPFGRPEVESMIAPSRNPVQDFAAPPTSGVVWLPPSWVDSYAQRCVQRYLSQRANGIDITVELRSCRPSQPAVVFEPASGSACTERLIIWYRSFRFFSVLLEMPSPELALKLGVDAEGTFSVSSRDLFARVFEVPSPTSPSSAASRAAGWLRRRSIPVEWRPGYHPGPHALDRTSSPMRNLAVLLWISFTREFERVLFQLVHARFQAGDEPWKTWGHLHISRSPTS
ncbi:hypothetical protein AURDEDRAFT_111472 [Auricularia subglabra TFB-10046 SS5]|nr:hypothetical protein AURDEDRAFT_111472 [Auricularia subglabra TFB-10046 SS5]